MTEPEFRLADMTTPRKRRRVGPLLIGLAGAVVITAAAAAVMLRDDPAEPAPVQAAAVATPSVSPSVAQTYRVMGTVTLARGYEGFDACQGRDGFRDIRSGAQVTVSDAAGATIAVSELSIGKLTDYRGCVLSFLVADVPAGKGFYGVEVSRRGVVRYSESELSSRNLDMSLG